MNSLRIVVTGSSGFLGSNLCPLLATRGHSVVGLDLAPPTNRHSRVEHRHWTATEPAPTDLGQVDAVLMLAQSPNYRDFPASAGDLWGVNVLGVARVMEAFHSHQPWLFHASTGSVYQPSFSPLGEDAPLRRDDPYSASKLAAEDLVRLHDGEWTIGRFFTIYGPGQRGRLVPAIIDRVRNGETVILAPSSLDSAGEETGLRISMAFVDDVSRLLATMLEQTLAGTGTRTTLNIGPPVPASIRDLANAAGAALGISPVLGTDSSPRTGDLVADTSRLESAFDTTWSTIEDGVRRTVEADRGTNG